MEAGEESGVEMLQEKKKKRPLREYMLMQSQFDSSARLVL